MKNISLLFLSLSITSCATPHKVAVDDYGRVECVEEDGSPPNLMSQGYRDCMRSSDYYIALNQRKKEIQEKTEADEAERVQKIKAYVKKNKSYKGYDKVAIEKKFQQGMPNELVILSIGEPDRVNTDSGSWGTRDQYVYGDSYLYFDNGILDSWQQTRD